ncbi:interferon-induced protein with tetratricopeptide repeats 1-like [Poecilia latipinna]|uniref:Interferon-induced protein with tetratricopeptide repeats 1-like n=3 Tax=Poecilia TaxID=8080 RepID=A0A087XE80_POEFO|nr:PREDICTED: interferon-induced protein with tetratricopeptide repeats 1-like [Poecilia formosa]XP_014853223.1 PREDICTED: interferon-induced protein with tetratricopeptide repeats 1-like [Poecilia mexicana]XP_014896720.1 PREDICTED: interferon-induced protein with tetratricopeptide repeats 1-like [Poecilia latipinna]
MSSPQSLQSRLKALECHFTWDLDPSRGQLFRIRYELEDVGTEEGNVWLGHIYNLLGFIQYKLGSSKDALNLFNRAAETFQRQKNADEGPWLMVNFGNLAWLHHHLGEDEKSEDYLSKVDGLMRKKKGDLYPEVLAEKAWTLMRFDKEKQQQALELFQRAIRMQPDTVEWRSSRMIGLLSTFKHRDVEPEPDVWEDLRVAREEDPENLYLAAVDLKQRAKRGEQVKEEAQELSEKILLNPVSSYSGIKPLLRIYRQIESYDDVIDVAERALTKDPDSRYLKRCAALAYKWKIVFSRNGRPSQRMFDRAISLLEDVISCYPESCLTKKLDFASVWAKSGRGLMKPDQIYKELLQKSLDPSDQQCVYNCYAKYLNFDRQEWNKSIEYHMKAAAINHESFSRMNSIKALERIRDRGRSRMLPEIREFLENLEGVQTV